MKLPAATAKKRAASLPGWTFVRGALTKAFAFPSFKEAVIFVDEVAELAEQQKHHPAILIEYNKVTLTLSTHSEGGVTEKDFRLAAEINQLV